MLKKNNINIDRKATQQFKPSETINGKIYQTHRMRLKRAVQEN